VVFLLRARDGNFRKKIPTSKLKIRTVDLDVEQCPTVSARGIAGCFITQHRIEYDGAPYVTDDSKPPYRVPLLSEIREVPWNGLTVVSTFAGAGGSSTGYRMAGYRVLLANEFVPVAQESYAANMAPHTQIDGRDIKLLKGHEILKRVGLKPGELDVFDGSPPCQAFSMAGQREKGWGKDKHYEHGASQKNEDLFFEYCRLRDELMPRVFVAENVSGLVKGQAKGYFLEILKRLKVGYRVQAQLLDAQWLGVPQARQRIIFVGVRDDFPGDPVFPVPLQYRYSVREALPHLSSAVHDMQGKFTSAGETIDRPSATIVNTAHHYMVKEKVVYDDGRGKGERDITDEPSPTITAGPNDASVGGGPRNHFKVTHDTGGTGTPNGPIDVTDRPCPTVTAGSGRAATANHYKVEQIIQGNSNAPFSMKGKEHSLDGQSPQLIASNPNFDLVTRVVHETNGQHRDQGDVTDKPSPSITSRMASLKVEEITGIGGRGGFGYRQIDSPDLPAATIGTQSSAGNGLSPAGVIHTRDGAGVTTKRKFTIDELKQICAFPPDFVLKGTYAQQWERLGNSVPPVMMKHIAEAIRDEILLPGLAKKAARAPRSSGRSTIAKPPKGGARPRRSGARA